MRDAVAGFQYALDSAPPARYQPCLDAIDGALHIELHRGRLRGGSGHLCSDEMTNTVHETRRFVSLLGEKDGGIHAHELNRI